VRFDQLEDIDEEARFSFCLYHVRVSNLRFTGAVPGTSCSLFSANFRTFGSALSVDEKSSSIDIVDV
jgi:hypothetical protein